MVRVYYKNMENTRRFLIGIDEAGRGPLAGPVSVGAVLVPPSFDFTLLEGVRDSKQMTELGREIWFERLRILAEQKQLRYTVAFSSARFIDTYGIVPAICSAIARALRTLKAPDHAHILLDGALRAPKRFIYQKTIIGGDESEPLIALASVVAKVRRDRLMKKLALRYPHYGFDLHKGYGTPAHKKALKIYGLCNIHRHSFCRIETMSRLG